MADPAFKVIGGRKYSARLLKIADEALDLGGGKISLPDAKKLAGQAGGSSAWGNMERETLHFIREHYRFADSAASWLTEELRNASASGWDQFDRGSSEISNPRKSAKMNTSTRISKPQEKKGNPLPIILAIIVLLLLGGGLFWYFSQPTAPAAKPVATTTTETTKPVEPVKPVESVKPVEPAKPRLLGIHDVIRGDTLWWISDKWYQDPVLWPNIYMINKDEIRDPDLIFPGERLDIPALIGSKDNLAPEDKTSLSQGYLEAYRVYKAKGKKDAEEYKKASDRYGQK